MSSTFIFKTLNITHFKIIAATKINQRAFLSNDYKIYKIKVFDFR